MGSETVPAYSFLRLTRTALLFIFYLGDLSKCLLMNAEVILYFVGIMLEYYCLQLRLSLDNIDIFSTCLRNTTGCYDMCTLLPKHTQHKLYRKQLTTSLENLFFGLRDLLQIAEL